MTTETKQKYTAEYKDNAVKRANESSNVAETARELGIKPNTLYNWVYQFSQRTNPDKPERTDEHLYDELKQLRKEVARLKEERDILKKAAAYFARETR
ncbi:MAG: transposase [Methylococcaceae bacterium]|nr:transposase [Methylococcaceae bacterium]